MHVTMKGRFIWAENVELVVLIYPAYQVVSVQNCWLLLILVLAFAIFLELSTY